MADFQQIIKLRNEGKTQEEIAQIVGVSKRSVIRYLNYGKIPQYKRVKATKLDPLEEFYNISESKIQENPKISLTDLFEYLLSKGYLGSLRTLRRKTRVLRQKYKNREVFFQREPNPGEIMEGDFTEFQLEIGGVKRIIHLWVVSLPFSNTLFATPYYHQTFECFADGSINAFREFGGIAAKYRLDNLSPAVAKILNGKNRVVTSRYAKLQEHYGFYQDFCNPGRGNEKGNVESNNKHLKRRILNFLKLNNIKFTDLESFKFFVWDFCRKLNAKENISSKFLLENLKTLPSSDYLCYSTEVVRINKYSMFSFGKYKHMYSAPSEFVDMRLECRIYPEKIELISEGKVACSHKRIYGLPGMVSIEIEHIIGALCKKPGAMKDWKHRKVLFERPIWRKFYEKMKMENSDKNYLLCLKLMKKYNSENLTAAMELALNEGMEASSKTLSEILEGRNWDIEAIKPIEINLSSYDELLKPKEKRYGNE